MLWIAINKKKDDNSQKDNRQTPVRLLTLQEFLIKSVTLRDQRESVD